MKIHHLIGISALLLGIGTSVIADEINNNTAITRLSGFQEVPSILTQGTATLKTKLDHTGMMLNYTLTFSGLSSTANAAHIHFGQPGVNGGVMTFLCGGGTKPACPATGGTVTGTIIASDIQALPAQGIRAGNFDDFLAVLKSGNAYANIHTTDHPAGEIRGQYGRPW